MKIKKLILFGIVSLLLMTLVISITTDYSNLGYTKNETVITKIIPIRDCFKISSIDTHESIKNKIKASAKSNLEGRTTSPIKLYVYPNEDKACWEATYNETTTKINIIYTDKTIIDNLNKLSYDLNNEIWIGGSD